MLAAAAAVAGNGDGYGMTDNHHFGQPSLTYRSNATASYGVQGAYGSDYPGYGGAPAAAQLQAPPRQQAAAPAPGSPYGQRSPHSGGAAAGYGAPAAGELSWQAHLLSCSVLHGNMIFPGRVCPIISKVRVLPRPEKAPRRWCSSAV